MLTKTDLDLIEQRIAKPLKQEIRAVEKRLTGNIQGVENRLSGNIQDVEKRLTKRINSVQKQITSVKKDTSYTVNFLDKEQLKTAKRVKIIEKHLGLPSPTSLS